MNKLQESFDATTRLQMECRRMAISIVNCGLVDKDIARMMADKAKTLSKELAEPGGRVEELLVTDRCLIAMDEAKKALRESAIPFQALQQFHIELVSMAKQASKRAQGK